MSILDIDRGDAVALIVEPVERRARETRSMRDVDSHSSTRVGWPPDLPIIECDQEAVGVGISREEEGLQSEHPRREVDAPLFLAFVAVAM